MRTQRMMICFLCMVFSFHTKAQNKMPEAWRSSSLFKRNCLLSFSHNLGITQTQPASRALPFLQPTKLSEIPAGSVKDLPFFCALECRLRARTGLWLKLRTGDDASYEKLIRSAEK